jgi:drug/metabolite transporter (DMT)-like permease
VSSADEHEAAIFEPLRPASRGRLVLGLILGPVLWLAALVVVAATLHYTWAIQAGLIVTIGTFLLSLAALSFLRRRRQRERQDAARG